LLFVLLAPMAWAVASALKPVDELLAVPPTLLPYQPTLDHFRAVLSDATFARAIANSLLVAVGTTALTLLAALPAGVALARHDLPGKRWLALGILTLSFLPQIAMVPGLWSPLRAAGLYNRPIGLILANQALTLPLAVWIVSRWMAGMPRELEEAARVDGAGAWSMLRHIHLPLAMPGLSAAGLLAFLASWNEYLFALSFTSTARGRTAPVALALFSGGSQYELPWGRMLAAALVVTLPTVIVATLAQRKLMAGLTAGAVTE